MPSVLAQGCSDAGFCSMGVLNQISYNDSLKINSANLIFSYSIGEQGTTIFQAIPDLTLGLFRNNTIQLRLPYFFINGNLGNNQGIGDLSLSITQLLLKREKIKLSITAGTKIATGHSDDFIEQDVTNNPLPLPMPYQTSLGTSDLILGASLEYKRWNFSLGYQHVIKNKNQNGFLKIKWQENADAQKYFESNLLDRGNDALWRVERSFYLKKISFTAGLLGIYRLKKDKINTLQNEKIEVNGSDGLTLNLTGSLKYYFSKNIDSKISFGTPLVVREIRPDGLTRELVINCSFSFLF